MPLPALEPVKPPRRAYLTIISYSIAMALLVFFLKFIEYRYLLLDLSLEFYIGVVAVLFTGLGIWAGLRLTRRKPTTVTNDSPFTIDNAGLKRAGISSRELEVLQLIAQGLSNQEIADRLFVSVNTIKTHTSSLFSKLDARRRTQAIQKAKDLRFIP